jgi:hypothetical protein
MRLGRGSVVALIVIFSASLAFGCSCSNDTPIQKTSKDYSERAVFTAHVVSLFGTIYNGHGQRSSSLALAIVKERYWGLPAYWPRVVLLDGDGPCGMALAEGHDYLVSGWLRRYGEVGVGECSRTQPLRTAQIDLRTLDGSHCAGPGGTIIGRLVEGDAFNNRHPVPNVSMTFVGMDGKEHSANTDSDGIYELQHLPPGHYYLASRLTETKYASSYDVDVAPNFCSGSSAERMDYSVTGRLTPGIGRYLIVGLVGIAQQSSQIMAASVQPDGRFYINNVPPGEYLLKVRSSAQAAGGPVFYPGTREESKASRIRVTDHGLNRSLDFDPKTLPLMTIPVIVTRAHSDYKWSVELFEGRMNVLSSTYWRETGEPAVLFGVPGAPYGIRLWGYPKDPMKHDDCVSEIVPISVNAGASPVKVTAPSNCR